ARPERELPRRAGDPGSRERGLRPPHAGRHGGRAALRPALAVSTWHRDPAQRGGAPRTSTLRRLRHDRRLAHRRLAAGRDRRPRAVVGREERLDGHRARAPDRAGPRPAAPHLPPLPALPRLPERRDASLRAGPRGAPPPAPPRGWDVLPRPRG